MPPSPCRTCGRGACGSCSWRPARFNGTSDLFDAAEAGQWLDLAHQHGIEVVGGHLPAYGDMARDVRRTLAIARFVSPGGQRFDAAGVDIERLDEVSLAQSPG
jgi:hypothetical protein